MSTPDRPEDAPLYEVMRATLRAGRTRMRQQGVPRDVCELALGHSLPQLDAVYDHGLFREEKRDAARKLEAHILSIVEPKKPARLPLAKKRAA